MASAHAETLEFDLDAGKSKTVELASPVDDSHLRDPRGYAAPGTKIGIFTRRIELSNKGDKPLKGRLLIINGRDYTSPEGLQRSLSLKADPSQQRKSIERLYSFWKDARSHAHSGATLASEPFAALNFWGFTLCGDDTQCLARLAQTFAVPARHVQLNGHVAGEYFYDDGWHIVDGDQNACYLRLDNQTLASADDLRADPFLALRTKIFGKHSPHNYAASAFNCSQIEHVAINAPKPIKLKSAAAPLADFIIHPGESIVWHADTPPDKPAGKITTEKPAALLTAALATIEHRISPAAWPRESDGMIRMQTVFPVLRAVNHSSGDVFTPKDGEVVFEAAINAKKNDKVSVFCQCSQFALPLLSRKINTVTLDSGTGKAHVAIHYDANPKLKLPVVRVTADAKNFSSTPAFTINTAPGVDYIWWQISLDRDFTFVPPNLDAVILAAPKLKLDALTDSFLTPGRPYYLRMKARADGVWGEWCEIINFLVQKPAQPSHPRFEKLSGGRVRLTWNSDGETLVFASNRLDSVPDIFCGEEILALENQKVTARRENKNLLVTAKENAIEFEPRHHFYRLIAQKGGAYSVPSPLLRLPSEMATGLPPALILQTRAQRDAAGKDFSQTKEELLPVK